VTSETTTPQIHDVYAGLDSQTRKKVQAVKSSGLFSNRSYNLETYLVAQLGRLYGWQAVRDHVNGDIEYMTMLDLVIAGQDAVNYEKANTFRDMYVAVTSALGGKKARPAFEKEYRQRVRK